MRIAVLGNCQVYGVRHGLKELLPEAKIDVFALTALGTPEAQKPAVDQLRSYDLVFSQLIVSKTFGLLRTDELRPLVARIVTYPSISFTGFHPDQVLLYQGGTPLLNAFGANHSAIIAGSFANGLPENRVLDLFNTYIFEKLGYFAEYDKAKAFLVNTGNELGFNLSSYFSVWQAIGSFMHTNNHPCIRVLATVARDLAVKAGLVSSDQVDVPHIIFDSLGSAARWPVYPQIAQRLAMDGNYNFTKRNKTTGLADDKCMLLDEFIHSCYQQYADMPQSVFAQNSISFPRKVLAAEVL